MAKTGDSGSGDEEQRGGPRGGLERREFFREGLKNFFGSVAKAAERRFGGALGPLTAASQRAPPTSPPVYDAATDGRILRPPGALREELFVDRCRRCGECVKVCPVQAIRPIASEDARLNGTPQILPDVQACVVCENMDCTRACPSGALSPVPRHLIEMGIAVVREHLCVRTSGEECQVCVEKCPIGPTAIEIQVPGGPVVVKSAGCVGCGVCEMVCPTRPRAIIVRLR